jgi:hypothetical protein
VTNVRLAFYVLYVILGCVIIVRLVSAGLRWELFTGLILGALLIALGLYRIAQVMRGRSAP